MKTTELILVIILAIILSVSKISDSLQKEQIKITEGKAIKHHSTEQEKINPLLYNEMSVVFNANTQEITFINDSRENAHLSN